MIKSKPDDISMPVIYTWVSSFWFFLQLSTDGCLKHHLCLDLIYMHFGFEKDNLRTLALHISVGWWKLFFIAWPRELLVSSSWQDLLAYLVCKMRIMILYQYQASDDFWGHDSIILGQIQEIPREHIREVQPKFCLVQQPIVIEFQGGLPHFFCCNWFIEVFLRANELG